MANIYDELFTNEFGHDVTLDILYKLNRFDEQYFDRILPGIGYKLSSFLIKYRNETGGFRKIEDLFHVQGCGSRLASKVAVAFLDIKYCTKATSLLSDYTILREMKLSGFP